MHLRLGVANLTRISGPIAAWSIASHGILRAGLAQARTHHILHLRKLVEPLVGHLRLHQLVQDNVVLRVSHQAGDGDAREHFGQLLARLACY